MENKVEARVFEGQVVWFRLLVGVMIVAAFAVSMMVGTSEAKAAPAQPVTRVFLDGDFKDKIVSDGVLRFKVYKGCHEVDGIQRKSGKVVNTASASFCADGPTRVTVTAEGSSVSIRSRMLN